MFESDAMFSKRENIVGLQKLYNSYENIDDVFKVVIL
jgi:hypothetical protein